MKKVLLGLFLTLLTFSLLLTDAEAKRFGGGRSFGHSRSFSNQNAYRAAPAATKPAATGNKWLGPLAGLAAGGLLASLFMGHGLGSGIFSWLMIGGLIFLACRFFSRLRMPERSQPAAYQQAESGRVISNVPFTSQTIYDASNQTTGNSNNVAGFDEAQFLRQAKTVFIRLQAAYDAKNLLDIREFTAPEVFAEVQMQLQERGDAPNQTDVITIDAELLDLDLQSDAITASVRFSGLIREIQDAAPENIKEIWHFSKDKFSQNWLVVGIQQGN